MNRTIETTNSPAAEVYPIPLSAVMLLEGFWLPKLETNITINIPQLYQQLEEHGVVDNFRRMYSASDAERKGPLYTDSDLFKWMEACCWALATKHFVPEAQELIPLLNRAIEAVLPAQNDDGYLNTWFVNERTSQRFTRLETDHELYCAGHLIQAGIAHKRVTGETTLFNAAIRYANLICESFGHGKIETPDGHPEIELALVELYRETGERNYLDTAKFFLDQKDFINETTVEGHAVRAAYFSAGATDVYLETGDKEYFDTLQKRHEDLYSKKIYITGGAGGRYEGESLGQPYELPNARAYSETCAAIGLVFWNWRMFLASPLCKYTNEIERSLYNCILSSVSLDGGSYFYMNPLSSDGLRSKDPWYPWARKEPYQRKPWHTCTCCPPNLQRLLASLPGLFFSYNKNDLWIHIFDNVELEWHTEDGKPFRIEMRTDFPWDGTIMLKIFLDTSTQLALRIRNVENSYINDILINGTPYDEIIIDCGYIVIDRLWNHGEEITVAFELLTTLYSSHPLLYENLNSMAIMRGPLVYCLESVDNYETDARQFGISTDAILKVEPLAAIPEIMALHTDYAALFECENTPLYRKLNEVKYNIHKRWIILVPYYAWANRGVSSMNVWIPLIEKGQNNE